MARSLLAFFASRFYDERKEHFNLPAERKGKKKYIPEEEIGLEHERVHARNLEPRLTRQSNAPLQPSRFHSVIFKALTFQAVIGYLSVEVFSTWRIVFFVKKRSCTIFICVEIKFNDLQVFIDDFLRLSTVFLAGQ